MSTRPFHPDYAERPGAYLEEVLDDRDIGKAEFAVRCGRPSKTISEIIAGKASIMPDTALQFERVLDIAARLWLALESDYQLSVARQREREGLARATRWTKYFPITDLIAKGFIAPPIDPIDLLEKLLNFFGVSSVTAWEDYWENRVSAARFKKASTHVQNRYAVAAWLRFGDITAASLECKPYSEVEFKRALKTIRALTRQPWPHAREPLIRALSNAGVAIAFIPDLQKLHLRGAAYWASKDRAVIIVSDRLKEESRFWFALFHEAMHILLHSKKALFIDYDGGDRDVDGEEKQADEGAANFLVPHEAVKQFTAKWGNSADTYSAASITAFAAQIDIAPSLFLARLQREGLVRWDSYLNSQLKRKLEF
jgi:HTH-type transcriptional regulator/antitoxin HigA